MRGEKSKIASTKYFYYKSNPTFWNHLSWTLTKRLEKKLDGNYTRMLRAILNKSWRQHPTKHQLYGHLPPITKTIQVRRTRHAEHCWRSRVQLISDVLLLTPTYGRDKAGRPARTYVQQLCEDTGCNPEDLPEAMNDKKKWRERVRYIRAGGTTWWWWWWYIYRYIYIYMCVCLCVCVCVCVCVIRISRKVDKPNTYNLFTSNISSFRFISIILSDLPTSTIFPYIYIYIYILPSTDSLFCCIPTLQSG